jgi:hypothetical protein
MDESRAAHANPSAAERSRGTGFDRTLMRSNGRFV